MIRINLLDYLAVNKQIPLHRKVIMKFTTSSITVTGCTVQLEKVDVRGEELTIRVVHGKTLAGVDISCSAIDCQILLENSILYENMSEETT